MLALVLVAGAVLGDATGQLAVAAVGAALACGLHVRYRGDMMGASATPPAHRERLDRIVAGDVRASYVAGLTAAALMRAFNVTRPDIGISRWTPVLVSVAAVGVLSSSLVDWYIVLPRISGMLGVRPCRHRDEDFSRFPRTWREMTRWWYVHRILGAVALRFGLAFAATLTLRDYVDLPGGTHIVVAAAAVLLGSYVSALPRAVIEAGHPSFVVGSTVERLPPQRRQLGVRVGHLALTAHSVGETEPGTGSPAREYVYDVSLEGIQVVSAASRETPPPRDRDGRVVYEREALKLSLRRAGHVRPADRDFEGCGRHCSGINWYCIENPRCFEPK